MTALGLELIHGHRPEQALRTAALLEDGSRNVPLRGLRLVDYPGNKVAILEWRDADPNKGEIVELWVHPQWRRCGIATALYSAAQEVTGGLVHHSEWRTKDGQAWALSLGEELPRWRLA